MKKKPFPILRDIEITDIAAEGNAIARIENKVLFVPYVIPGDVIDVQITRKKSSFMEGKVVEIKKPSSLRLQPFCEHFGVCGGCKWQALPYAEQIKYKQKQVVDAFQRIGKIEVGKVHEILGSEKTEFYRNKLEYTFSDLRWLTQEEIQTGNPMEFRALGFHVPGMFDKIIDIRKCHLQADPSNEIRLKIKQFAFDHDIEFCNIRNHTGLLRNIIIRTTLSGKVMLIVVFQHNDSETINALLDYIASEFSQISALMYAINGKANDTLEGIDIISYRGDDHIVEEMEGLKFKIGPKSFYQTNSQQAYTLYKVARDFANLTGNEIVYDLYTGTGTIANFVAAKAQKVVGIEYVPEAIEDAKANSKYNNIENTSFFAGDMKDVLTESFIAANGKPDVMIIDPPRAGMHGDVVKTVLTALPERIVYVSCNPATQARDIALMNELYAVEAIQPVDMFPHTHHVENVALLVRK